MQLGGLILSMDRFGVTLRDGELAELLAHRSDGQGVDGATHSPAVAG